MRTMKERCFKMVGIKQRTSKSFLFSASLSFSDLTVSVLSDDIDSETEDRAYIHLYNLFSNTVLPNKDKKFHITGKGRIKSVWSCVDEDEENLVVEKLNVTERKD